MSEVKRQLNLFQVIAIIIGLVIGSGVFINIAPVQRATGSPGLAVIAWAVGGLFMLPQIFIYAELGTAYPGQGFGYLYLQPLSDRPGLRTADQAARWRLQGPRRGGGRHLAQ